MTPIRTPLRNPSQNEIFPSYFDLIDVLAQTIIQTSEFMTKAAELGLETLKQESREIPADDIKKIMNDISDDDLGKLPFLNRPKIITLQSITY